MPTITPAVEIIAAPRIRETDNLDPEKDEKQDVIWDINFRAKITGSTKNNPAPWKVVWMVRPVGGSAVTFKKEGEAQSIYKDQNAEGKARYFSEGGQMQVKALAIDAEGKQFASGSITVNIDKSNFELPKKPEKPGKPGEPEQPGPPVEPGDEEKKPGEDEEREERCEEAKEKVKGIGSDLNRVRANVEATARKIKEMEQRTKILEGKYHVAEDHEIAAFQAAQKTIEAKQQIEKLARDICEKTKKVMNATSLEEANRLLEQIQTQNNALIKLINDAAESFKKAGKAADKAEQLSERYVLLLKEMESLRGKIDEHKFAVESIGQDIQQTTEAMNHLSAPSPASRSSSGKGFSKCREDVMSATHSLEKDYTPLNSLIQELVTGVSILDSAREWIDKIKKAAGEARASANSAEVFYEADQFAGDAEKCATRAREDVDKQHQGTLEKDAKAALQSCDFKKARNLIAQMPKGPKKTALNQEYQAAVELKNRLKALVNKANGAYKGGNYGDALSTLREALSDAKCDKHRESINKKIAKVNEALLKLYNNAKTALQACGFEKARSLIDQMLAGPKKTALNQEYQAAVKLKNRLKALVKKANGAYKVGKYGDALSTLRKALSEAKCDKHRESINKKIALVNEALLKLYNDAKAALQLCDFKKAGNLIAQMPVSSKKTELEQEYKAGVALKNRLKALVKKANGAYKVGKYGDALSTLRKALSEAECYKHRVSINKKIAQVQGKANSGETEPDEQVACKDCSRYGDAKTVEAYWDADEKRARCKCKSGYKPSGNTCVPTRETLVQNLDCRAYPNTYAAWDRKKNRAACFCINKNYKWRSDGKGCIPKSGRVVQQDPMCPAAVYAIKNKLRSGDNSGLTLLANNAKSMGCTDPVIDQVLSGGGTGDCSHCKVYEDRLKQLGTGYSGTLRSICENNPECVRWVQEWNQVKKQLRECLAQCQNR